MSFVRSSPTVAIGPETPGWGSWDWVGQDLVTALARYYSTSKFGWEEVPRADIVIIVKHALSASVVRQLAERSYVLYCPIDYYGGPQEIDRDADMLRSCTRVIVHCARLAKFFARHAPTEYMDHHVKF